MFDAYSLFRFIILSSLLPFGIAIGQKTTIAFAPAPNAIKLASSDTSVAIVVESGEWPAVLNAAQNLGSDFGLVTGRNSTLYLVGKGYTKRNTTVNNTTSIWNARKWTSLNGTALGNSTGVILAGTIGASSLIDELVRKGKLDARSLIGGWETFISSYVDNPVPGISRALVIAGEFIEAVLWIRSLWIQVFLTI
jgi:hypothetical protein